MFSSKQTLVVPEIHGEQNANTANLGQVPNLELESGTTGAPGHIIQQDGDKFDLQFGRMALGSSTTFPAGHVIQTSTPTIYTGSSASVAGRTRLGSTSIYYHPESSMTNSITKIQGTSSFLLVHYHGTFIYTSDSGAHGWVIFADGNNYYAVNDDFNRINYPATQHLPRLLSGSVPFLNMAAGSYTFTFALARATDANIGVRRNYRANSDGLLDSECSSSMYIQEIAG